MPLVTHDATAGEEVSPRTLSVVFVVCGVLAHIPQFLRPLADVRTEPFSLVGTFAVGIGIYAALLASPPSKAAKQAACMASILTISIVAATKPLAMGVALFHMRVARHLEQTSIALLCGALVAGAGFGGIMGPLWADKLGRQGAAWLAAVIFVGTSVSGALPAVTWNALMCFLAGASAAALPAVAAPARTQTSSARFRGRSLVFAGAVGAPSIYVAACMDAAPSAATSAWRMSCLISASVGMLLLMHSLGARRSS